MDTTGRVTNDVVSVSFQAQVTSRNIYGQSVHKLKKRTSDLPETSGPNTKKELYPGSVIGVGDGGSLNLPLLCNSYSTWVG